MPLTLSPLTIVDLVCTFEVAKHGMEVNMVIFFDVEASPCFYHPGLRSARQLTMDQLVGSLPPESPYLTPIGVRYGDPYTGACTGTLHRSLQVLQLR